MRTCIALLILLVAISCELVVDVDVPMDNANKVVINAVAITDSTWTVQLTRTNHILSPLKSTYFVVDFADVVIYSQDGSSEKLSLVRSGSGLFKGTTKPLPGQQYKVAVTPTSLPYVEAEMTMPSVVPIVNIEWDSSNVYTPPPPSNPSWPWSYDNAVPMRLTFTDPPGEKNFYQAEVWGYYKWFVSQKPNEDPVYDTIAYPISVAIEDPAIASQDERRQRFSDNTFEGRNYVAKFRPNLWTSSFQELLWVEVRLVTLSEPLYKYMETLDLSEDVEGDPFSQPVQVYSNTSNSFGVFGGISYDRWRFDVKKP